MPTLIDPWWWSGRLRLHASDLSLLQRLLDPLLVGLLFLLLVADPTAGERWARAPELLSVASSTALVFSLGGLYGSYRQKSLRLLARRVTLRWLLVLSALLLVTYFTKTSAQFSRLDAGLWAGASWLAVLFNHVGLRKLLRAYRSKGGNQRTILYWGLPSAAASFASQLHNAPWMGLRLLVWFSPQPPAPDAHSPGLPPCSGGVQEMRRWLSLHNVDRIVFSHVTRDGLGMDQLLQLFGDTSVPVVYAPHWATSSMRFGLDQIGNQACIELWGGGRSLFDRQLKRAVDLLVSASGLLLIAPLLLLIAVAVAATSPGPVLFGQDRYGLDGRRFRIYKFRTMRVVEAGDQPGLQQATRDDPRVTPLGGFLRRWSLDELPQLFNVLIGQMSLVGPRPHAVDHNEQYRQLIPGYMQRHAFKPGITGLAQVEGWRGETSTLEAMASRVEADLRYQRDWSLKLDIKILIKTILHLRSPNAY